VQRQRYRDDNDENIKYPGAYKIGTDVLGLMRDNINWKLAEILAIREAKFWKETIDEGSDDDTELNDDLPI
jgi:hypothetical protein